MPSTFREDVSRALEISLVTAAALFFASQVLTHLAHPLLWHDEADTAVFAQRVAEHGYPRVGGEPDLRYNLDPRRVAAAGDAYLGGLWGAYYLGAPGAAWAAATDDPDAKTWRMRLPFALLGCVGVLWVAIVALPAFRTPRARAVLLVLFGLAAAYSVSLVLHLRQARWYAPALFCFAGVVALHLNRFVFERGAGRAFVLAQSALLFALFNTFHPAFVAVSLALGLDLLWRARRVARGARLAWLVRGALPLLLAAALCLPVALAFDLLSLTLSWTDFLAGVARSPGENLGFVAAGSLRYEFLGAALLARLAVFGQLRGRSGEIPVAWRQRGEIVGFVLLLVGVYWAVVSRSPLVWERYLIPLSPWISLALLLDGATLVDLAREPTRGGRRVSRLGVAALVALALAATLAIRWPEFSARQQELRVPVRGPLDFAIAHLRARHPDPRSLVIATNYEGPAYSFYLGSRVVVGYYAGRLESDAKLQPDVIVLRPWPRFGDVLRAMAARAPYVATALPVRNTRSNGGPFLWRGTPGGVEHFFATPVAEGPDRLVILERVAPAPDPVPRRD
jgi:hypothetical protein